MGYYINPPDQSKEQWLAANGEQVSEARIQEWHWDFDDPFLPVCLVDNGGFTAAGIAYCSRECEAFLYPDGRSKIWFIVPKAKLTEMVPGAVPWGVPEPEIVRRRGRE